MTRSSLIEDISDYNRVHEMFQNLKSENELKSELLEGFRNLPNLNIPIATDTSDPLGYFTAIKQGNSMVVNFAPFSGLLSQQDHYIPLSFIPLEIELELSTDPKANIIDKTSASGMTSGVYPEGFDVSELWSISEF